MKCKNKTHAHMLQHSFHVMNFSLRVKSNPKANEAKFYGNYETTLQISRDM